MSDFYCSNVPAKPCNTNNNTENMQGCQFDPILYLKPFREIVTALWITFLHSESAKPLCAKGLLC